MTTKEFRGLSSSVRVNCILYALFVPPFIRHPRETLPFRSTMRRVSRKSECRRETRAGKKRERERRRGEEWKRSKSLGRNKASYRANTFFCRQPLRFDPCTVFHSFLAQGSLCRACKAPLNEVNCSESNQDLRYVLAREGGSPFAEAHVEIARDDVERRLIIFTTGILWG